jgi:riboflavin synthase
VSDTGSRCQPRSDKAEQSQEYAVCVFTGIVRERGNVVSIDGDGEGLRLSIAAPEAAGQAGIGDSISISGVCLTVVSVENGTLDFDAVAETLRRSSLGRLQTGDTVNVEPALRAGEPLGGHYVQGHVDGVGRVRAVEPEGESVRMIFEAPSEVLRYCVEKGSIAVEGVSLTITDVTEETFGVALVPHTLAETTLGRLGPGDEVNLEADVLAKYVERLVARE